MKTIGTPKCFVQYRYTQKSIIDRPRLVGAGLRDMLSKEFNFSQSKTPGDSERATLNFKDGRITVKGKAYVIEELDIGNIGMSTWVWTEDHTIGAKVLDRTQTTIDESMQEQNLTNSKKWVSHACIMKVKLENGPKRIYNEQVVSVLEGLSDQMKKSTFSEVEVQFPVLAAVFYSKPDIKRISAEKTDPTELEDEINMATGLVKVMLQAESTQDYAVQIFEARIDTDLETAKSILDKLDTALHAE